MKLKFLIMAEITTRGKGYPTEVYIDQKANLSKPSFIQADNLHTVPKDLLEKYVGALVSQTRKEVSRKVVLALELEDCIYEADF